MWLVLMMVSAADWMLDLLTELSTWWLSYYILWSVKTGHFLVLINLATRKIIERENQIFLNSYPASKVCSMLACASTSCYSMNSLDYFPIEYLRSSFPIRH